MLANAAKEEKLPGQEADTAAPELTMTCGHPPLPRCARCSCLATAVATKPPLVSRAS